MLGKHVLRSILVLLVRLHKKKCVWTEIFHFEEDKGLIGLVQTI